MCQILEKTPVWSVKSTVIRESYLAEVDFDIDGPNSDNSLSRI